MLGRPRTRLTLGPQSTISEGHRKDSSRRGAPLYSMEGGCTRRSSRGKPSEQLGGEGAYACIRIRPEPIPVPATTPQEGSCGMEGNGSYDCHIHISHLANTHALSLYLSVLQLRTLPCRNPFCFFQSFPALHLLSIHPRSSPIPFHLLAG